MNPDSRGRTPISVGALGLLLTLMVTVSAFNAGSLPIVGAGAVYTAAFTEAAGLKAGNEVRVAGVKVGRVTSVALNSSTTRVLVRLQVANVWVGDQVSASIQIKTVLGQKFVALDPRGTRPADSRVTITRTTSPYDVVEAISDVGRQTGAIDTDQLAQSFRALSGAFAGTPSTIAPALDGLTRLSQTVAARDQELQRLFAAAASTSRILADKTDQFTRLIDGAGTLLTELNARQQSIAALLSSTTQLSTTLTGIVRDNQAQIGPALESLRGVTDLLRRQDTNLRDSIVNLAPMIRLYANVLGTGRWFDGVITNLLPPGLPAQNTTRLPGLDFPDQSLNRGGSQATG